MQAQSSLQTPDFWRELGTLSTVNDRQSRHISKQIVPVLSVAQTSNPVQITQAKFTP